MKYALFLGCTIPARARNYELSARRVAETLGIELIDVERFVCCGFPIKSSKQFSAELLSAYNLALASEAGLELCTLCSSCTSALTEVAHELGYKDESQLAAVNSHLGPLGIQYSGRVTVRHFARILIEDIGVERIRKSITKDLSALRVAVHYGCHYLKPSDIYGGFDQPEEPTTLEELVSLTGAEVIDYRDKKKCCGGPVLPVDEKVALSLAKEKLDAVHEAGADLLCLVCPFCSVMYDGNQKGIENEFGVNYGLPVLYLTQLLGLAMGLDRKALGLNMNVVKTKDLMKKIPE